MEEMKTKKMLEEDGVLEAVKSLGLRVKKIHRRISWEEFNERWFKGLCMFCDELETPDHHLRHKNSGILMMEGDEDQFQNDKIEFESEVGETDSSNHVELSPQLKLSDCAKISSQTTLETMSVPKPELIHAKIKEAEDDKTNSIAHPSSNQTETFENEVSISLLEPSRRVEELQSAWLKNNSSQYHIGFPLNGLHHILGKDVWFARKVEQVYILDDKVVEELTQQPVDAKANDVVDVVDQLFLEVGSKRIQKNWKFRYKQKNFLRILFHKEEHEYMGRKKFMCKMRMRQNSWDMSPYSFWNKEIQRWNKCKCRQLRLMEQSHKPCFMYKQKKPAISRGRKQFSYMDVQFFKKHKGSFQKHQTEKEVVISRERTQFIMRSKWRFQNDSELVLELVLCFDCVELSTSYENSRDFLWTRWSSTVRYGQTFDPRIRLELLEIPRKAAAMVLVQWTKVTMEKPIWEPMVEEFIQESVDASIDLVTHHFVDSLSLKVYSKRRELKYHWNWKFKFKQKHSLRMLFRNKKIGSKVLWPLQAKGFGG